MAELMRYQPVPEHALNSKRFAGWLSVAGSVPYEFSPEGYHFDPRNNYVRLWFATLLTYLLKI